MKHMCNIVSRNGSMVCCYPHNTLFFRKKCLFLQKPYFKSNLIQMSGYAFNIYKSQSVCEPESYTSNLSAYVETKILKTG